MTGGKELAVAAAKTAATAALPEVAIPLEVISGLASRARSPPAPPADVRHAPDVLFIPPDEHPKLIHWGKEKVRVRVRKGIRIVTIDRKPGLTAKEIGALILIGGAAIAAYEVDQYLVATGKKLAPQKNALGIPFGNVLPGGGANPLNYVIP